MIRQYFARNCRSLSKTVCLISRTDLLRNCDRIFNKSCRTFPRFFRIAISALAYVCGILIRTYCYFRPTFPTFRYILHKYIIRAYTRDQCLFGRHFIARQQFFREIMEHATENAAIFAYVTALNCNFTHEESCVAY